VLVQPVSPGRLVDRLVAIVLARSATGRCRVVIDGAPPTRPGELADALVDPLRAAGRPVVRVHADDFLRPASLRWEHGRRDPGARYDDWLDLAALEREVLAPLAPGGSGSFLPTLWDARHDRSTRAVRLASPPGAVLVLDGSLLLGRGLGLDLTVHLATRSSTLDRRTLEADRWALPAFARYARDVAPEVSADVVVHVDDPRHPALRAGAGGTSR